MATRNRPTRPSAPLRKPSLDFAPSTEQEQIKTAIERVCAPFDADTNPLCIERGVRELLLRRGPVQVFDEGLPVLRHASVHRWTDRG